MKILKKVLAILVAFLLLVPGQVNALDNDNKLIYPTSPLPKVELQAIDCAPENYARATKYRGSEQQLMQEMEELVKNAILNGENKVDISEYEIDITKYNCLLHLQHYSPYLSKMDIRIPYYTNTNTFAYISINNKLSLEETEEYFNEINSKLENIYDKIDSQYNDEQIALTVHDYLTSNYIYDKSFVTGDEMYCAGGLLYNGKGVCNAYAYLYEYIMHKYNIESYVTSSDSMNHAWNIVKIDGSYYHVDCTWDDPVYSDGADIFGQSRHDYFLKSDENLNKHSGWNRTDLECTNEKYDNYYWINIDSPIVIKNDYAYYIENETNTSTYTYRNLFKKRNISNNNETILTTFDVWNVWNSNSFYPFTFSGLFINDNYIYYNTANTINKFSILDEQDEVIYNNTSSDGYIYGIIQKGKDIAYTIKQKIDDKNEEYLLENMFSIKQSISLDDKNLSLKKGDTYQLKYNSSSENLQWESNNTSVVTVDKNGKVKAVGVGTAIITVSTEDGYQATCKVSVTASIANCNINKLSTQTYTGGKIEPALTVKDEDKTLVKNEDYTVSYKNNVNVGTATAIIKGKGNYTDTKNIEFTIQAKELTNPKVELSKKQYVYDGKEKNPTLKVTDSEGKVLTSSDYDVTIPNGRKNAGTYTYIIQFKKNYKGSIETTLEITKADVKKLNITISTQTYTGKALTPLKGTNDYSVTYKNNINVGTATAIIKGKGNYTGTANISFEIKKIILPTSVKLNASSKTILKGKTYTLVSTVTPSNATNKKVTYSSNNKNVATVTSTGTVKAINYGTATITVKTSNGKIATCKVTVPYTVKYNLNGGTNNTSNPTYYYGKRITLQNPTRKGYAFAGWYSDSKYKTKITSFTSGNRTLYAKWSKVTVAKAQTPSLTNIATRKMRVSYKATSGVKGYQIQYATNSKFTGSQTKTTTSRSYVVSSLTKGKRYYVRVRGYKVDSTGNKVYGSWSTVRNIMISK